MSVVWGVINTDGKEIDPGTEEYIEKNLKIYKLDSLNYRLNNNVLFGCGMQFITPESIYEVLPYHDENRKLTITADAIIDNRKELFELLNIPEDTWGKVTDSELILKSYEKWGKNCTQYLIGDFAFAIWNEKAQELFCARDHTGTRTFYYYYKDNQFIFCTVIKPIIAACNQKMGLNERWIADFLTLTGVVHQSECEETIYTDIMQLPPANLLILNKSGITKKKYWNPLKSVKRLKLKSDKEYYERFIEIFTEAVRCRLRCNGDVAISLSGGLDSGSVACIAAQELKKQNKSLKAFSFISLDNLKYKIPSNRIANESEYIEAIKERCGNIDVTYCKCEGKDSYSKMDWFIQVLEQPYKNIENSFWNDEINSRASQSGCRVLLTGQYGNVTISYGNFFTRAYTLYRHGSFIRLIKEIKGFSKIHKASGLYVAKVIFKSFIPFWIRKLASKNNEINDSSFVDNNLIKKWDIETRFKKQGFITKPERYYTFKKAKKFIVNPIAFTQIGTVTTKTALAYGIIKRDPTMDKRVIEFCLSLPDDLFVRNGEERRLVRKAMKGILPDKVRLNVSYRGIQHADWIQRLEPKRKAIIEDLEDIIKQGKLKEYIDLEKFREEVEVLKDEKKELNECNIRMLLIVLSLNKFLSFKQTSYSGKGGEQGEERMD